MLKEARIKTAALLAGGMVLGLALVGTPAGAHVGGSVGHLWNHVKPKADKRYLPGGNVVPGRTIRGTFSIDGTAAAAGVQDSDSISFGWTLAQAPVPHFIAVGAVPPVECPGTAENPKAKKGHLCVYEAGNHNVGSRVVYDMNTYASGKADRFGFGVYMYGASAAGFYTSHGTWAVQTPAPSGSSAAASSSSGSSSLAPAPGGGPGQ